MKLTIAWIGRTKNSAIQSLADEYINRLRHFAEVEGLALKDEAALLKFCDARSARQALVIFDAGGKQFSSEEFAQFLQSRLQEGTPLLLAIGPADGFSDTLRNRANFRVSLGKMTIAHELARVVALEQIYRAFTILKGHPYHLGH